MGRFWPFIGIAIAVAIGVAAAPYVGGLVLVALLTAALWRVRRAWPWAVAAVLGWALYTVIWHRFGTRFTVAAAVLMIPAYCIGLAIVAEVFNRSPTVGEACAYFRRKTRLVARRE